MTMIDRDTVQCNACGKTAKPGSHDLTEAMEAQEFETFDVTGGYGNRHWGDEAQVIWTVCQDCLAAWLSSFVVPAISLPPAAPGNCGDDAANSCGCGCFCSACGYGQEHDRDKGNHSVECLAAANKRYEEMMADDGEQARLSRESHADLIIDRFGGVDK